MVITSTGSESNEWRTAVLATMAVYVAPMGRDGDRVGSVDSSFDMPIAVIFAGITSV